MRGWFAHRGDDDPARLDDELAGLGSPLTVADRSCCCAARPAVTVIMPPAPGRSRPVDLLLCGHHYQASRTALRAAGATVYDEVGVPIMTGGSEQPPTHREPAATAGDWSPALRPDPLAPGETHVPGGGHARSESVANIRQGGCVCAAPLH